MGLGRCPPPPKAECGLTMLYTSITDHPRDLGAQGALPLGPLDGASRSRTRRDVAAGGTNSMMGAQYPEFKKESWESRETKRDEAPTLL